MQSTMSIREAADIWGINTRSISHLCETGNIPGAVKKKNKWRIPIDATNPMDRLKEIEKEDFIDTIKNSVSIRKATDYWNIDFLELTRLCEEGAIRGAVKVDHQWRIPINTINSPYLYIEIADRFVSAENRTLTIEEAADIWEIDNYRMLELCSEGKIPGAVIIDDEWQIPKDVIFPIYKFEGKYEV